MGEDRADARARQMTTFDLTAADGDSTDRVRLSTIAGWLAGWTALVVAMAGIVTTQKGVAFVYSLISEAVNYYTLAAVSLVVWFASAGISARRWPLAAQVAVHVALGVALTTLWQAVYGAYMWSVMGA